MNTKMLRTVLWIGLLLIAVNAQAAQIQGGIRFGALNYKLIGGNNFSKSTGIDFSRGRAFVAGENGDYGSVPSLLSVKLGSLTYDPFPPIPRKPLWSFTVKGRTYSFHLLSVTVNKRTATDLVINARGTLRITGKGVTFDPTPGEWNFRANRFGSTGSFKAIAKVPATATNAPIAAPEIDAASGTSAIALLVGALLLAAERSRRSLQVAH